MIKWKPSSEFIKQTNISQFADFVESKSKARFARPLSYGEIWKWSIESRESFWSLFWDYSQIIGEKGHEVLGSDEMPGAKWFPQSKINYAENLLKPIQKNLQKKFIDERMESQRQRSLTGAQIQAQVSSLQQYLRAQGVQPGDRVAGYVANTSESLIAMLATVSLGAIWSSASPDFGVQGVLDRFGQIQPKILFAVDGYFYNGKRISILDRVQTVSKSLPDLVQTIVVPILDEKLSADETSAKMISYTQALAKHTPREIDFERVKFDHPLFIMFSSGTTGVPKCIVHGHGGTLIQHKKEHLLHCNITAQDNLFYFTTCGWMMWNWQVSALACGAQISLYDGSPFYNEGKILYDYSEKSQFTHFGTSAKFIDACAKENLRPKENFNLSALKMVLSTGSPLSPEGFDYVYDHIGSNLQLASISGGTDIISCFVLGSPILPVYRGEIQAPGLGMDIAIFNDEGEKVVQDKGELVCRSSFPSMPIYFWGDESGEKYFDSYFSKFKGIWCHGDYVEETKNHGYVIYGRSDAVLNPGGVRIGTAEIYRQVEKLPEILESIVVGQDWQNDVRVVLFVKLKEGVQLDAALADKIKTTIRANTTPRHVPAKILVVKDIPRTKSGKIVELAVRNIIHDRPVKNREALANPEALGEFQNRTELQS